ncbi:MULTISPECIES: hypothetical protein [Streptomyces]|uniref:Uncharacterized protein n=1 Tax=Streptomyces flavovirens TaxID=52258 RepID=A0ABV8N951_9ACTN|nr:MULTISPECIES: hypothetical protein [unclassified Streptomyces]MBK3590713.1 hypothetical protein [Streptomyces sp. MBT51]MYU33501.1 hypothetical protein [Streptomyces sp. SID8358]MYX73367.1 hypothetical protein [Streptomyces sp. SID3915]
MNDVRELLARAARDAGRPAVSTGAVYARAARVRFRRRAGVAGAALAVVATGGVALPQLTDGTPTGTSVAAAPVATASGGDKAGRLAALLPEAVGGVEQVSLAALIKGVPPEQAGETYVGPLDGQYLIREDGGAGYLTLSFMKPAQVERKFGGSLGGDLCATQGKEPPRTDCVRERLPDGGVLTTWRDAMAYGGSPQWGPEITGRLVLKDGSLLAVRSSTGYLGPRSQGPLLRNPPLDRAQVRALMLRPELRPRG